MLNKLEPFGGLDCETELKILGVDEYSRYYFYHTRFNREALKPKVSLIIGRRGAGKTALSHFFSFQKTLPHAIAIDVDEPAIFQEVMSKIAVSKIQSREIVIPYLVKIWDFVIWSIIFRKFAERDQRIQAACPFYAEQGTFSSFARNLLNALFTRYTDTDGSLGEELTEMISKDTIEQAKSAVLELAKGTPIIIAIDTLENYSVRDETVMRVTSALIQCATQFNQEYASQNIQVKLFIMAEIFPYLKEEVILNPLKFVRNEVYLHWRPKDLLRLICWRFWHYLKSSHSVEEPSKRINWDSYQDVLTKCWEPFFGQQVTNGNGLAEKTFPYILRHTQMRPRQLILLCNSIAEQAEARGAFPQFSSTDLIKGIKKGEERLADEIFNSYNEVYPGAARIAEALSGLPLLFKGNLLDRRAPHSASQWPKGLYSQHAFRQFVAELGIVGRVRQVNKQAGYIEADFEYAKEGRLPLLVDDDCVIHPMFYKKLNIQIDQKLRVYPFPDHEEFKELDYLP